MAGLVAFKTITGLFFTIIANLIYMGDCCCPRKRLRSLIPRSRSSFLSVGEEWNEKYENYQAFSDHFLKTLAGAPRSRNKEAPDLDVPYYRWS